MKLQVVVFLALVSCELGFTLPTVYELQNTERMLEASDKELSDMVGE